jgi:hypothetical protein
MKNDARDPHACKVTTQYRLRNGFMYELEGAAGTLAVHIAREDPTADAGDWRIAAHTGRGAGSAVATESAPTRTEALRKVGNAWTERSPEFGLVLFDWEQVAEALHAVRAI